MRKQETDKVLEYFSEMLEKANNFYHVGDIQIKGNRLAEGTQIFVVPIEAIREFDKNVKKMADSFRDFKLTIENRSEIDRELPQYHYRRRSRI